ncbi:hypothetical protein GCM10017673_39400 [Streptosporangium violaceochromogenes]|nr:hypothetical protein GCM10017673_39400 [Streptosporangium violaceochromogenes]
MVRRLILTLLVVFGVAGTVDAAQAATTVRHRGAAAVLAPPGCRVEENFGAVADDYISRCRRASVRSVFPAEHLDSTLAQIKVDRTTTGRTAWKLLTDGRFAKS